MTAPLGPRGLVILDRDGVINRDSREFVKSADEWLPLPGSIEAIARASRAGFRVAIATNQSGLSRGYFTLDDLEAIHQRLCEEVEAAGGHIAGIFYCPHLPTEGCSCRKPATGLLSAIETEIGTSPRGCPFVGDSLRDLQAARAFGCDPVLVRTGKGEMTLRQLQSGDVDLRRVGFLPARELVEVAGDLMQVLDLTSDQSHRTLEDFLGSLGALAPCPLEQVEREVDRSQRVLDVVGDLTRHLAPGGVLLGLDDALALVFQLPRHAVEVVRERTELVLGGDVDAHV